MNFPTGFCLFGRDVKLLMRINGHRMNFACTNFADASIWIIQFMKAMRDENGDMVRNAHLLGFFRRICKLLFLRIKPVFVFDGGTPLLKRRTVIARRKQRESAQFKIRKTAEKLLLNHVSLALLPALFSQSGLAAE